MVLMTFVVDVSVVEVKPEKKHFFRAYVYIIVGKNSLYKKKFCWFSLLYEMASIGWFIFKINIQQTLFCYITDNATSHTDVEHYCKL